MSTTYRLKATELNQTFIESVRALYGETEIEIDVHEAIAGPALQSPLEQRIAHAETRTNLVFITLDDLKREAGL
jgi:hypothetical protein